jgi:hypothetical protein
MDMLIERNGTLKMALFRGWCQRHDGSVMNQGCCLFSLRNRPRCGRWDQDIKDLICG